MLKDCKYFDLVGNRCSRVTDGKCDNLPECEFKYIEALKAENDKLKEELNVASKEENLLKSIFNNYRDGCRKQYQTLQEIKTIAEKECKDCLNKRSDSCWICPYYPILQLITKAESDG